MKNLYALLLTIFLLLAQTVFASADVVAGPIVAIAVGLQLLMIAVPILIVVLIILFLKKHKDRKGDE